MSGDLKSIQDNLEVSKHTEILRWLSPEPYIQHHEQIKIDVLQGTGQWLLSDPVFATWRNESVSSILWLHGMIGSGKSKLISIVIEDAMQGFHAGHNNPPAFFYCSRNTAEPARSEPQAIIASLARQLSNLRPEHPLLKPAIEIHKKKEAQGFASGRLRIEESCALIIQLVEHYPLTIIVIDALDECNPEKRDDLLEALETILEESSNLVKIFVSSRDDQDIVLHFQHYPNLEIKSDRNTDDIVRWASLQLQNLCSFKLDADICDHLGRLPPTLETLYSELYDKVSAEPAEFGNGIFRNVLTWLLCAQRTLKRAEFLAAISIIANKDFELVSKDEVLELCNNFVVFDTQLDTFRFTHLSVREFLEKRPEYTAIATNSLVAEICLLILISTTPNSAAERFLSEHGQHPIKGSCNMNDFGQYPKLYWAKHCQLAADARAHGSLKDAFQFFLSSGADPTSAFSMWISQSSELLTSNIEWDLYYRLQDIKAASASNIFVAGSFDFPEVLEDEHERKSSFANHTNSWGADIIEVCMKHGSCKTMIRLLDLQGDDIKITEEGVKAAAGDYESGEEVMRLLLDKRGEEVKITEGVVEAAAGNSWSGEKVVRLLLDQRGEEVKITEGVVEAAARNFRSGEEVMRLLLDRRGKEVMITEGVVEAAAGNDESGEKVMRLLLHRRGEEVKITEAVVEAAAGNNESGEKVKRPLPPPRKIKIGEEVMRVLPARNFKSGEEVMRLLLDRRGEEVKITQGTLGSGEKVMRLLLHRRGEKVKITEGVVEAAAGNSWSGEKVMRLLLHRRGEEVKITEGVVKAAAGNDESGEEVMRLLLNRRGEEVKITEGVLEAAARNLNSSEEVVRLLLDRRGEEVKITEGVLEAAARNFNSGEKVMRLLLDRRGEEVKITERVVKAAAANESSATPAIVQAAVAAGQERVLRLLDQ
ncbi:MAG: hypothetical protein M1816_007282, partial [Peltula sp. TS41687]